MDDSISRQEAVNKLRAEVKRVSDSLFEAEGSYSYCEMVEGISTCLDDIPSAEPEIIYCNVCRYYGDEDEYVHWCNGWGWPARLITPDDFCSRGKRREDD